MKKALFFGGFAAMGFLSAGQTGDGHLALVSLSLLFIAWCFAASATEDARITLDLKLLGAFRSRHLPEDVRDPDAPHAAAYAAFGDQVVLANARLWHTYAWPYWWLAVRPKLKREMAKLASR
jgi:hypothetical protein